IGPGRAGVGFALGLARAGLRVSIHGRAQKPVPSELTASWGGTPPWIAEVDTILLAVPDDAIHPVARDLAASNQIEKRHTVLHLSGVLDRTALLPLDSTG